MSDLIRKPKKGDVIIHVYRLDDDKTGIDIERYNEVVTEIETELIKEVTF